MRILFILILLLFQFKVEIQSKDFSFEFEPDSSNMNSWHFKLKNSNLFTDKLDYKSGKGALRVQGAGNPDISGRNFAASVSQLIQLPSGTTTISASLYSKSENIKDAWLKLFVLDNEERLVSKDSIRINANKNSWNINRLEIPTTDARKLFIEISVDNLNSEFKGVGKIWLDKMDLRVNGEDIRSIADDQYEYTSQEIEGIHQNIPLDVNNAENFRAIPGLKDKKIIAIGESVHGVRDFNKMGFELIKYLILHENCRLVLWEIPYELGILTNYYVSSNTDLRIDTHFYDFLFDTDAFLKFIDWLKQYNAQTTDKVYFMGIDIDFPFVKISPGDVFRTLTKGGKSEEIIKLLSANPKEAFNLFERTSGSELGISVTDRKIIAEYLRYLNVPEFSSLNTLEDRRDYYQFQHTRFAVDSLIEADEKAAIYAHMGHVNKKNNFGEICNQSLGNYMANYYGNNYFVVGLFAGEGNYTNYERRNLVEADMENAPAGSLEALCKKTERKVFYKDISDGIQSNFCRNIGNGVPKTDFLPLNCKGRMDAFIYMDKVSGFNLDSLNTDIRNNLALKTDSFTNLEKIPAFREKRIIGLGETVTGCYEFGQMSNTIIKFMVEKENCRLVILNISFELGLLLNEYVGSGTISNIDNYLDNSIMDPAGLKQLLDWIRNFNFTHENKVRVGGIIRNAKNSNAYLLEYINLKKLQSPSLDTLKKMLDGHSKTTTILEYLKKTPSLKNDLGAENYRKIELSLQSGKIHLLRNRLFTDSIDFEMVKYAIDNFLKENEKAVICDHFAKLNKDFSIVSRSAPMGNYMKTYYGDQYFVIGMLCGKGNHTSQDFYGKKSISALSTPPLNSLENICMQTSTQVFYKDSDSRLVYKQVRMFDRVQLPGENFSYSDSKGRMDGFIFIREVSEVKF